MPVIRRGEPGDIAAIRAIQAASPQAAQWDASQYLDFDLLVAAEGFQVHGFLVARTLAPGEYEILNLAVAPDCRRQGVASALLERYLTGIEGNVYLEVRPSNATARQFYKYLGFEEVTIRANYYQNPQEPAIVMKFHSC